MRVAVIDADETVFDSVRAALASLRPRWRVDAFSGDLDVRCAKTLPSVALVDFPLTGAPGLDGARRFKELLPRVHLLIHTSQTGSERVLLSLLSGAAGYLVKPAAPRELVRAIEAVLRGERWLSAEARHEWSQRFNPTRREMRLLATLTAREVEVLASLILEQRDKEIAERLGRSRKTVEVHASNLYRKLGVHSRREVQRMFLRPRSPMH